jgi:hypothetical protein
MASGGRRAARMLARPYGAPSPNGSLDLREFKHAFGIRWRWRLMTGTAEDGFAMPQCGGAKYLRQVTGSVTEAVGDGWLSGSARRASGSCSCLACCRQGQRVTLVYSGAHGEAESAMLIGLAMDGVEFAIRCCGRACRRDCYDAG